MKKSFSLLLLLPVIVVSIVSCRKSNHSSNNSSGNGTLLSKYIELDTTLSAPYDTIRVITLQYDNAERLSSLADVLYDNLGHPDNTEDGAEYSNTTTLHYNGADTLTNEITQVLVTRNTTIDIEDDTDYLSYDINNRIIKDSAIDNDVSNVYSTTLADDYNYNGITITNKETIYTPSFSISYDTAMQTLSNVVVISQVDNTIPNSPIVEVSVGSGCTFTFDTHPNPFYRNGFGQQPIFGHGYNSLFVDGIINGVQKNNYTSINEVDNNDSPSDSTNHNDGRLQYTYNSNGYPATVLVYPYNPDLDLFHKAVFIYK